MLLARFLSFEVIFCAHLMMTSRPMSHCEAKPFKLWAVEESLDTDDVISPDGQLNDGFIAKEYYGKKSCRDRCKDMSEDRCIELCSKVYDKVKRSSAAAAAAREEHLRSRSHPFEDNLGNLSLDDYLFLQMLGRN